MDRIDLKFQGYWREANKGGVPSSSGIYCVHRCTYDGSHVDIKELLYIGESENVSSRIDGHERHSDWSRHLRYNEVLCYSFTPILHKRVQAEAALINYHKPIENIEFKSSFPFPSTSISTNGRNAYLKNAFTVYDTRSARNFYY